MDPCIDSTEKELKESHKKYNLKLLIEDPNARIFKP